MFKKWWGNLFFCRLGSILYRGGLFLRPAATMEPKGRDFFFIINAHGSRLFLSLISWIWATKLWKIQGRSFFALKESTPKFLLGVFRTFPPRNLVDQQVSVASAVVKVNVLKTSQGILKFFYTRHKIIFPDFLGIQTVWDLTGNVSLKS